MKRFFREFHIGIRSFAASHRAFKQYKIRYFLFIPALLGALYGIFLFWYTAYLRQDLSSLGYKSAFWSWVEVKISWIFETDHVVWFYIFSFKYIVLIFLSPFLAWMSEKIEFKVTQKRALHYSFKQWRKDVARAIKFNGRNLGVELILTFVFSFIPYLGPLLIFLVQGYYYGFGLMDYTLERKRYSLRESLKFGRKHSGMALGIGLIVNGCMFIPIAGALFAPTYGTAAATLSCLLHTDIEQKA